MTRPTYVGTEHSSMTALTLTILEYYAWKKSRSKSQVIRALLAAFPRVDPAFDFDELEWFAENLVFPVMNKYPESVADLKADLKRFREREYTTHTSLLFESDPSANIHEVKSEEKRTGDIAAKIASAKRKRKPPRDTTSLAEKLDRKMAGKTK